MEILRGGIELRKQFLDLRRFLLAFFHKAGSLNYTQLLGLVLFHSTGHFSMNVDEGYFRLDIETVGLAGLRHSVMVRRLSYITE